MKSKSLLAVVLALSVTLPVIGFSDSARAQDAPQAASQTQQPWTAIIAPDNSLNVNFYKDGKPALSLGMVGWAPGWEWRGLSAAERAKNGELNATALFEVNKDAGEIVNVRLRARQSAPRAITFQYTLSADKNVPLTMLIAGLNVDKEFQEGDAVITQADGTRQKLPLSFPIRESIEKVAEVEIQSKAAEALRVKLEPPTDLAFDHGIRLLLAKDKFEAGTKTVTLTLTLPQKVAFLTSDADLTRLVQPIAGPDWFAFNSANDVGPSPLGFDSWLDKPAGKHGGVRIVGDHFKFEDGTPIKFWGTNLSYGASAPAKENADFTAARFAKWGVNAVRMHKFTGSGWEGIGDPNDATKMTRDGLDKLDYFSAQLTKNGVYYGWSHTFKFRVKNGNRDRLLAYAEIEKNMEGDTYALINAAPDIQDLLIETVVNLLKHPNPYTGKTYAQDPALAFIEMHNEDDIFFYSLTDALDKAPTYKKQFTLRFNDWLQKKYGSTEKLEAAWGDALRGQTLEHKNVEIQTNPWFFSDDHLPAQSGGTKQRLLDNAAFFHGAQNAFYSRFAKAIRDAGYRGPLVGSPWQAPPNLPQLYNLASDAKVGYVDRHNYFGGGLTDTMLKNPGGGMLSVGLQQVANRPFGVSEWIHVYPSLYSAEGPALMAAYGMGLQGWDGSFEFQSDSGIKSFSGIVGNFPWGVWNADVPTQIGQYPILARMIARGDVPQGETIAVRRVSPENLATGQFDFSDKVMQQGDITPFGGSVPEGALAAGRAVVEFVKETAPSTFPDLSQYRQGDTIKANNGALLWDAKAGYFTINTAGTKGVVGFAQDKELELGDFRAKLAVPYASLLVTAAEKNKDLANCKTALISAMARNANSGSTHFVPGQRILENGQGPILMEPVKAILSFPKRRITAVNLLDADGKRSGRALKVEKGEFMIDQAQDKTLYYEVVFGD